MYNVNSNYSSKMSQSNPSFGMALNMNKKKIAETVGAYLSEGAESVRPQLERLADDVDIFVQPSLGRVVNNNALRIYVQDITPYFPKSKNPITNYINKIIRQSRLDNERYAVGQVFISDNNVGQKLVSKVKDLRRIFLQSK